MRTSTDGLLLLTIAFGLVGLGAPPAKAQRGQYCERTNYSAQEITDAVRNSSLRDDLKSTSCSLGGLGRFELGGNKGVYNGSCCTGIFQLNNANVRTSSGKRLSKFRSGRWDNTFSQPLTDLVLRVLMPVSRRFGMLLRPEAYLDQALGAAKFVDKTCSTLRPPSMNIRTDWRRHVPLRLD